MRAAPAVLAVPASLTLAAWRHWRTGPGAIKIGSDGLTVWNRAGHTLAHGRVARCSQWRGRLLILAPAASGRPRPLLIAAGTLSAEAFRAPAVPGRRTAGA